MPQDLLHLIFDGEASVLLNHSELLVHLVVHLCALLSIKASQVFQNFLLFLTFEVQLLLVQELGGALRDRVH